MTKVFMTKLFQNGGSRAVRIPAEICPTGPEVFVWSEPGSGRVTISENPPSNFEDFFALQKALLPLLTEEERSRGFPRQQPLELPTIIWSEVE